MTTSFKFVNAAPLFLGFIEIGVISWNWFEIFGKLHFFSCDPVWLRAVC